MLVKGYKLVHHLKTWLLLFLLFSFGCRKKNKDTELTPIVGTVCQAKGWASMNGGTTGGGNAQAVIVNTYSALKAALENSSVKVVQVEGNIAIPAGGKITIQNQQGKTIYGMPGATLSTSDQSTSLSGILYLKQSSNIIIQNLTFDGAGAYDTDGNDNLTIEASNNVWIDHCEFRDGLDGNLDIKTASDFITVSWCKFIYNKAPRPGGPGGSNDHRFANLVGAGDASLGDRNKLNITFARCWWGQGCVARMPRVRFGKVHVLNSYFNSTLSSSCVQAGIESNLLIEGNVFEGVKNPIDLMANNTTAVLLKNNVFTNTTGNTTGNGVESFLPPYSYTALPNNEVKNLIITGTGATLSGKSCSSF